MKKKKLQWEQQPVSVTIGYYRHLKKVTSTTREVIIENDGGTPGFNKYIIGRLCGHSEDLQLTQLKCVSITDEVPSQKHYH